MIKKYKQRNKINRIKIIKGNELPKEVSKSGGLNSTNTSLHLKKTHIDNF